MRRVQQYDTREPTQHAAAAVATATAAAATATAAAAAAAAAATATAAAATTTIDVVLVLVIHKQLVLPTYHIYSSAAPLCCNASGICRLCIVGSLLPFYGDCLGKEDIPWDPRAMNGKNLVRQRRH